jgi:hypothetical protein
MSIRLQLWLGMVAGAALFLAMFGVLVVLLRGWLAPGASEGSRALFLPIALAGLVLLALVAPLAWLVARLAYAPVRDVTKTARSIMATGQLDRRCFYPGPRDDVGELVVAMNGLLVCYDLAIGRIRRLEAGQSACSCPRDEPDFDPSDFVIDLKTHHEGARSI